MSGQGATNCRSSPCRSRLARRSSADSTSCGKNGRTLKPYSKAIAGGLPSFVVRSRTPISAPRSVIAAIVGDLSVGDRQLVEIARALRRDPKLLIFDEPTSSLSRRERERLFEVIRGLRVEGVAIIYISHFLDEIFEISDDLAVMRNGRTVFSGEIDSLNERDLIRHMMGTRENEAPLQRGRPADPSELLRIEGLSRGDALKDVNLSLKAGEVVGLWGLLGSGRTELLRALVGLDPVDNVALSWSERGRPLSITPSD